MADPLPGTGRRQQKRTLETRATLLATATREFSAHGYEGVSVRQLESMAELQRGLVAYHFGDKDGLWRAVIDHLFTSMNEDFVGRIVALSDVSPVEAARAVVRAFVRYSAANPALNRLMMQESFSDSWRMSYLVDTHIRPLLENLGEAMPEAARLLFRDNDPHRYYLLIGAGAFVFSADYECRRLFGQSPIEEEFVERHADLVAQVMVPGDQAAAGP